MSAKPLFPSLAVQDNASGWGPAALPEAFEGLPYQPFAKSDRLGRVADFTSTAIHARANRYTSQFGPGDAYAFDNAEDDSSFRVVDIAPVLPVSKTRRWQPNKGPRRDINKLRDERRYAGVPHTQQQQHSKKDRRFQQQQPRRWNDQMMTVRAPSIDIQSTWTVLEEFELNRLGKMTVEVGDPEDLLACGSMEFYDKSFDKVSSKTERPLPKTDRAFANVTTTDDPHIRHLAKTSGARVFVTDSILATIMTAPRSVYSWDIIVHRVGDKIFFDKRDGSTFDLLSVDENSNEPPSADAETINTPLTLAAESLLINQSYSQKCLQQSGEKVALDQPNPFAKPDQVSASAGYKYRRWQLNDDISVVCRTEHDCVVEKDGKTETVTVKALNEWKRTKVSDWRTRLDTQRGAVVVNELKNNNVKLARWATQALLAGSDHFKLGFVSRTQPNSNTQHAVIGSETYKPAIFAQSISLDMNIGWGIVNHLVKVFMKHDEGEYVLLKDPMKSVLRIYKLPADSGESDDEEEEEEADGAEQ